MINNTKEDGTINSQFSVSFDIVSISDDSVNRKF